MTKFTVKMVGNKEKYPVLLSNGNLVAEGDLEGGKHYAVWVDPWKKPSYLFALVAGQYVRRVQVLLLVYMRWEGEGDARLLGAHVEENLLGQQQVRREGRVARVPRLEPRVLEEDVGPVRSRRGRRRRRLERRL